jgi:hypothetical protein
MTARLYMDLLSEYREGEVERFREKYTSEWQSAIKSIPKPSLKPSIELT